MPPDSLAFQENYIQISKHCLLKAFGELTFDLFVVPKSKKKLKEPLLLVRKHTLLPDKKDLIGEKGFDCFYIKKEEQGTFHHFIENYISMLIEDTSLSLHEKSKIIYTCATNIIKDVFNDPRSGENLNRAKNITNNIIQFALADDASIPSLLQLSSHDYYTFSHCLNVAVFSIGLWQCIYEGKNEGLHGFALGCILHDVGKSRIEDAILNKPGKLTAEEFTIIKTHPRSGYDLMKNSVPDIALDVILHHHEKHDGRGYPDGLSGTDISEAAKIASIADVYDALTTKRSYAEARDPFKAILTMKEEMVGHFEQEKFISFIHLLSGKKSPN